MRDEVPAKVLAIIEDHLLTHGKQNIYEVLERLGVRDAKEKVFDYVWEGPSGVPIFTIWAEFVAVHPISGRMFYVEDLSNRTTLEGGAEMDTGQLKRTQERRRQMEKVRDGKPFIAVLQSNARSIDELMRNVTAKPLDRIKDSHWHVARWDEIRQRAIMVRGEAGWEPTDEEVDLFINERRLDCPVVSAGHSVALKQKDSDPLVTFRFPDQAHRNQVEAASMAKLLIYLSHRASYPRTSATKTVDMTSMSKTRQGLAKSISKLKAHPAIPQVFSLRAMSELARRQIRCGNLQLSATCSEILKLIGTRPRR